jgi:hypothetical protein
MQTSWEFCVSVKTIVHALLHFSPLLLNEWDGWITDNPQVGRVLWPEFKAAVMEKNSPLCQGAERGMCNELRGLAHNYINRNGSAM